MLGTKNNPYDVIISGAGPSGLSAGIICARHDLTVLVCEKYDRPSPFPRGETLHDAQIFTELLGENVLNLICQHLTAARKFNSPNAEKFFTMSRRSPSLVFEWKKLIDLLLNRANEAGVQFRFNSEVSKPIFENNICIGVEISSGEKIFSNSVLVCDGNSSKIGRFMNVPYEEINCPIVKRIISNFHGDYQGFEYFFIANGMLEYAPRFPPAIIFVFPRGEDNCEVGLMVFTSSALKLKDFCDMPDDEELLRVWHQLIESYPKFSELMKGTHLEFEGVTNIATAKFHEDFIPKPGLILIGGSIGFVESSGASGIASSMQMGKFAGDFIAKNSINLWDKSLMMKFRKEIRHTKYYNHIIKVSKIARAGKNMIFVKLRTADKINKNWGIITRLYKLS